jgi:pectin methylesterase-like acyl-CoA thioesterase
MFAIRSAILVVFATGMVAGTLASCGSGSSAEGGRGTGGATADAATEHAGTGGAAVGTGGAAFPGTGGRGNGTGPASGGASGGSGSGSGAAGGPGGLPTGSGGLGVAGSGTGGVHFGSGGHAGGGGDGVGAGGGRMGTGGGGGTGGAAGGMTGSLPAGVVALFPPPDGRDVCPDPPLRLTFAGAPTLGTAGKVQVFNSSGSVVASLNMASATVTDTIGGTNFILLRPAYVDGNTAVVYLKTKALAYGQTYYVTVDAGAIRPPGGGSFAIAGSSAWRFTTAAAGPASPSELTVALDGSGQFCSVQGATDALPASNTAPSRITIANGTYHEIVHVSNKANLTLHGQDRKLTILAGTNNDMQQTGNNPGTANRALLGFDGTNGLVVENLTIHNLTPQDGTQAEALRLQSCDKCIVRDADILSLQDTLLWSGRVYAENCLIQGNVDYVWGTGVAYFNKCELRTVGRSGVIVQSRNGTAAYGYVFVDSKLTADGASTDNKLARIDVSAYPGSHVAYINCQMTNVAAAGWTITGGAAPSTLRFWEYGSTDAANNPLNVAGRMGGSQINVSQATSMRDPMTVLGGWKP